MRPDLLFLCFLTNKTLYFENTKLIGRRSYLISVAPGICFENVPDVLLSFSLYCLVCQYVKERWLLFMRLPLVGLRGAEWRITDSNR